MSSRPVGSGFGPRQLAEAATRRPRRVLLIWGLVVVVSFVLIGALLPSAITSENSLTNNPESTQAQDLIDERLPDEHAVDELIVVRSENATISDPAFEHRIETLVADARKTGSVAAVQTPLQPGTEALVSRDRHAAIVAIVLKEKKDERIDDLVPVVEAANGQGGFAVSITGENTLGRDFTKVSEEDLSNGELRFGLPAALIVLLLVFGTLTGAAIPMLMAIIS
ncbi:MAG TPA: MMPL family transporter, partial [Thermoleophilaceae bacterium]